MAAEGKYHKMMPDMEVFMSKGIELNSSLWKKIASTEIHKWLAESSWKQNVDMSTMKCSVVCFINGSNDSGSPPLIQMFTNAACSLLFFASENA